jgi:hypothetical protein
MRKKIDDWPHADYIHEHKGWTCKKHGGYDWENLKHRIVDLETDGIGRLATDWELGWQNLRRT